MIEILNPTMLARAKDTGALVADILQTLKSRTTIGTNLLDIDRWTKAMIVEAGAQSCYVDYAPSFGRGPFGHYICTAVNDAVLHGRPYDDALADGDLLTAKVLLDGSRFLHCGYFCHQAAEKAFKAVIAGKTGRVPPRIHELVRLARIAGVWDGMSGDRRRALDNLVPLQLEGRYPAYKEQLEKALTGAFCAGLLADTEDGVQPRHGPLSGNHYIRRGGQRDEEPCLDCDAGGVGYVGFRAFDGWTSGQGILTPHGTLTPEGWDPGRPAASPLTPQAVPGVRRRR